MPTPPTRSIEQPAQSRTAALPRQQRFNLDGRHNLQEDKGFFPVVGIIGTVTGTLTALACVPFNPQKDGVLVLSGLFMCLGLAVAPILAFLQNPRNILRTENIVGMAGIYWLFMDLVTARYDLPMVDQTAVRTSFLSCGVFVTMFWVGTLLKPWRLPKVFVTNCSIRPELSIVLPITCICFAIAMLSYAVPSKFDIGLMFGSLLNNRFATPWARSAMGGWNALIDHLVYFGYLLPTLSVMIMRRKGLLHPASILSFVLAGVFLMFLLHSGSRRIIGVCLGSALIYWVLDRERVRISQLVASVAFIGVILFIMQAMLFARGVGVGQLGASRVALITMKSILSGDSESGAPKGFAVDDNFYRLAQVHSIVPEHHDWVYWRYVWYVFVRPIPRVLWPSKPLDGGFDLQDFNDKGATLSMSIVGEAWISWGFPAIIVSGWFFGRLSRMNSPLFSASSQTVGPMFYGYMTMMLFVGWRSLQELLLFSYALLGWICATWIFSKIRGRDVTQS